MKNKMTSRERLLNTLSFHDTDYIPMAFMIFTALRKRIQQRLGFMDPVELVETQIRLGLDAFVDLRFFTPENDVIGHSDAPGFPVRFDKQVTTVMSEEIILSERYPVIQKEYRTPEGTLDVAVNLTGDWPYGNLEKGDYQLPFMDDYLAPRCRKYLINRKEDLAVLKYLMIPPDAGDLKTCRESWQLGKKLAKKNNLMVAGGWGVGGDALAWLCGLQNAVIKAIEEPDFFADLIKMISDWNKPRMEAYLDFGVDLYIRRAWYEGTDFWSPDLFRQFFLPVIKEEVQLAHEAGSKYGYILTSGSMPIHDQLIEAGIDVLIGADPVQGKGTDLKLMKEQLSDKVCIWGGINGFVTVETGTDREIEKAVKNAIDSCGPGGLILSPVDNISDPSDEVWNKMLFLIKTWKKYK